MVAISPLINFRDFQYVMRSLQEGHSVRSDFTGFAIAALMA